MNKISSLIASLVVIAAAVHPVGAARFDGAPVPRPAARRAPTTLRAEDCSEFSLRVAVAKAQAEMRALLPAGDGGPAAIERAMNADARFSARVQRVFGGSDIVKSEYTRREGCVVTVRLPLDRLQALSRARTSVN